MPKNPIAWRMNQLKRNAFRIEALIEKNSRWEFWALLTSDQHWDNPRCNRDLLLSHLNQAKERGAVIISAGDLFCAMQGKYDKRANKSALRPEHRTDDYFDALVDTAADYFNPFAKNIAVLAVGNHEQSIINKHEVNLTERLIARLNEAGGRAKCGGFSGWVAFSFKWFTKTNSRRGLSRVYVLHYDHGYGGGGPVTADMIQHYRRAAYLPDANIVLSGHTHDSWMREISQLRFDPLRGAVRQEVQTHLKLPSYQDDYQDGFSSWQATKGMPPKPLGGYWLRFYYSRAKDTVLYEILKAE